MAVCCSGRLRNQERWEQEKDEETLRSWTTWATRRMLEGAHPQNRFSSNGILNSIEREETIPGLLLSGAQREKMERWIGQTLLEEGRLAA